MKLDPESVKARREHARKEGRRVEARRELSGNMSFGGRELGVEEGLAAKAYNDADAIALRRAGMPGSLRELRVLALLDRIAGRNPMDRLARSDTGDIQEDQGPGAHAGSPAPVPALINLLVPAGTLLGWSSTPGDAGSWGLLDADDTRTIVQAASQHSSTRWCVTVIGPDGTAAAHGCARGQHPWTPPAPPREPGQTRTSRHSLPDCCAR